MFMCNSFRNCLHRSQLVLQPVPPGNRFVDSPYEHDQQARFHYLHQHGHSSQRAQLNPGFYLDSV